MKIRFSSKQVILYGLVVLLTGALIGSVSLTYPFGRDQAFYAYAGKLLLEGKMNYLYVFDLKPPGSHMFFAMIHALMGESMFNARIFDIIWQSAAAFILFLIVYRISRKTFYSYIASFLYLLLYYRQDYWHTLQADGMLNLPLALCILMLVWSYQQHSYIKVLTAGISFALALIFKYTIIVFMPLAVICLLLAVKEPLSIRFKNTAVFLVGAVIICGALALWYQSTGALKEMIDIQFGQTSQYTAIAYETEPGDYISAQLIKLFTYSVYSPLVWVSAAGFIMLAAKKKLEFQSILIFSWIISSLFSLIIQWKFYYYHFHVIIASLSAGAVVFSLELISYVNEKRRRTVLAFSAVVLCGFILYAGKPYPANYETLYSYLTQKQTLKEVYIKNGITTDSVFMLFKTFNAIDYVNQSSESGDKIYVWGYDPLVYYLTGRNCVSRFVYHIPLMWKAENSSFRKEFIESVNKTNPKLIVVAGNDPLYYISGYNEDSKQLLERFPEFKSFIDTKYSQRSRINDYDFYELTAW